MSEEGMRFNEERENVTPHLRTVGRSLVAVGYISFARLFSVAPKVRPFSSVYKETIRTPVATTVAAAAAATEATLLLPVGFALPIAKLASHESSCSTTPVVPGDGFFMYSPPLYITTTSTHYMRWGRNKAAEEEEEESPWSFLLFSLLL
ncbi:hypothetical protein BHE74_00004118 [Ensete ventricosum]|nr:hypothetical protein BHE74_00004118 [Ensete ventricosum]